MPQYDALIIGAGAAGVAAAAELAQARCSALVLEARDRIGGRCWSKPGPSLGAPVELGAEFIHGRPAATLSLLRRFGAAALDAPHRPWISRGGTLEPRGDSLSEICTAMGASPLLERQDLSFDVFLESALRGRVSDDALAFARMRVEGYDAADPAQVSARAIVGEWLSEGAGAALSRPLNGYGALLAQLAGTLDGSDVHVQTRTIVSEVRWQRGAVEIDGSSGGNPFCARGRRAIITLPLGVLQAAAGTAGAVQFTPRLEHKQAALERLATGPVIKLALQFDGSFWEALDGGRYRDATFFHAPGRPFPTFWTALPRRLPLLMGWAGGPNADRLADVTVDQWVKRALESLDSLFGTRVDAASRLVAAYAHDWKGDPFARGAYSYVRVGGDRARETLSATLEETLHFAGEAADHTGEAGTVAGALQSGRRAGLELIAGL